MVYLGYTASSLAKGTGIAALFHHSIVFPVQRGPQDIHVDEGVESDGDYSE
jgi:hypothetical protein